MNRTDRVEISDGFEQSNVDIAGLIAKRRTAVLASMVGTSIEWYDFILYSIASGLIFPSLYFAKSDPLSATLSSYGIFALGFVARPLGALIFGHYGDRIGRKGTLIATLIMMGLGTFSVALVPTYVQIGIAGAVTLTVLRFIQGVGVGGEWAGSVLVAMEWARPERRGFAASWPQIGVPLGLVLANLAFAAASFATGSAFMSWGWRLPFAASILLVGLGFLIRRAVEETPVFRTIAQENRIQQQPVARVIKQHYRKILIIAFMRIVEMAFFQVMTVFIYTFSLQRLHLGHDTILQTLLVAACVCTAAIPVFGNLSDRVGRKRLFIIGTIAAPAFAFAYFALLSAGSLTLSLIMIALSLIPFAMMYGSESVLIADNFSPELRYSGSSIGYQLSAIIGGGPTPIIVTLLFHHDHTGFAIAGYILVCAIISLIAVSFLKERHEASGQD